MKVGLSGGYFNFPLQEQMAYFQSMPEYLLYDALTSAGVETEVYGTKEYPLFKGLDVFNCHHISRTMQWLGLTKRYPLVITLHNPFIASGYKPKLRWRTLHALRSADALVALSETEKNHLIRDYGVNENRVTVIPNGLKLSLYKKPAKLESRKRFGIPEDHTVILTVGQLLPYKCLTVLVKVAKNLMREHPKVSLVIKTLYKRGFTGADGNIHVVTEKLTQQALTDLYYSCDVYAQPSTAEALCTCITEAMLCGKPVVASNVGGTSTQIQDGKTGLLVPVNKPKELYEALDILLSDRRKAEKMGEAAAEHAKNFNQETMTYEYLKLYKKLA